MRDRVSRLTRDIRRAVTAPGTAPSLSGLALAGAGPARAECLGSCADGLTAAIQSLMIYGLIAIVMIVALIRAKSRRAGLWGLGIVALLALGLPLLSQGWLTWKLRAVEAREVVGRPPPLAARTPLLIAMDDRCWDGLCAAVLQGRSAGTLVLLGRGLDGIDLSRPVRLADLPLELWTAPVGSARFAPRRLAPEERRDAAARIDYLVIISSPRGAGRAGPVEAALRGNPDLAGMGPGEVVHLLMAPVPPGQGSLSLATLRPDLLDLTLTERALAIPLAPRNTQDAANGLAGSDVTMQSICPQIEGVPDDLCRMLMDRDR
ncbi:MAG: hypothetical protein ACK4FR_08660 [Tabrizicola sp.]